MTKLIDKPASGQPGVVPAGDAILDLVHVEDAARATVLAANGPCSKAVALMPEADIAVEEGSWNGTDHHYDLSAAESVIGYTPRITLAEGLRENIAQIRRRSEGRA